MVTMKCSSCKQEKLVEDFHKDRSRVSGYAHRCKQCQKDKVERWKSGKGAGYSQHYYERNKRIINARNAAYYQNNKEAASDRRFFKKYGITRSERDELLVEQGSVCAVCEKDEPQAHGWCVDHNHDTGVVRGILCQKCNSGIGFLEDNWEIIQKAEDYMRRTGG